MHIIADQATVVISESVKLPSPAHAGDSDPSNGIIVGQIDKQTRNVNVESISKLPIGEKEDLSHDVDDSLHTQQRNDQNAMESADSGDTLHISEVVSLANYVRREHDIRSDSPSHVLDDDDDDDSACNISRTDPLNTACTLPDVVPPTNDSIDTCIPTISDTTRHDDVNPRDMCTTSLSCKASHDSGIPTTKILPQYAGVHSQVTNKAPGHTVTKQPMSPRDSMSPQPKLHLNDNPTQHPPGGSLNDGDTAPQHLANDVHSHKSRPCPVHGVLNTKIQNAPAHDAPTPQEEPTQTQHVNSESDVMEQFKVCL